MTNEEQAALAAITEILERLTRIETRLCKLMLQLQVDPSNRDGYHKPPATDLQAPVRYW